MIMGACSQVEKDQQEPEVVADDVTGEIVYYTDFESDYVKPRNVEVWLPPSYRENNEQRYPVLYMHDGQNVFNPATAYTKIDWNVDGVLTKLIEEGKAREAIVVGIWNTDRRLGEYMPAKPVRESGRVEEFEERSQHQLHADDYLKFLTSELKPYIDETYRTLPDQPNTMIMGSSMGGLISGYAIAEYPGIFGAAGCVSTHWPIGEGIVVDWFGKNLPESGNHKLYFDYGTAGLDESYEPYQLKMNELLVQKGYREGEDFVSFKFDGADHNEAAWQDRVDIPLLFLLGLE